MTPTELTGTIRVPSDKSITHRSFLFSALAWGNSRIRFTTIGRDNLASLRIVRQLGVAVEAEVSLGMRELFESEHVLDEFGEASGSLSEVRIEGRGIQGLTQPTAELDCGNSGTTSRLLCGILAACSFDSCVTGDRSLRSRPFRRVSHPLSLMGANFSSDSLPITISGGILKGLTYESPKASAQVKSALLLAGLRASEPVVVIEPTESRNHTELMLRSMGCVVDAGPTEDKRWKVELSRVPERLHSLDIEVPGDFSSAAFYIVAALIVPNSRVLIENVGFSPSRIGLYDVLLRMGADISIKNARSVAGEPVVDLEVCHSQLRATDVNALDVVRAIDEIPILSVAASFADGVTRITGAAELRTKESDRISMMVQMLGDYGVDCRELDDGLEINGATTQTKEQPVPESAVWMDSHDHRIAMCASLIHYANHSEIRAFEPAMVETSFPGFVELLRELSAE